MKKFFALAIIAVIFPCLVIALGLGMEQLSSVISETRLLWGVVFGLSFMISLVLVIAYNSKIIADEQEKQTELLKKLAEKSDTTK